MKIGGEDINLSQVKKRTNMCFLWVKYSSKHDFLAKLAKLIFSSIGRHANCFVLLSSHA